MPKKTRTPKCIEREFIHLDEKLSRVPRGSKRTALVAGNRCKSLVFSTTSTPEHMASLIAANMPSFGGHVDKNRYVYKTVTTVLVATAFRRILKGIAIYKPIAVYSRF